MKNDEGSREQRHNLHVDVGFPKPHAHSVCTVLCTHLPANETILQRGQAVAHSRKDRESRSHQNPVVSSQPQAPLLTVLLQHKTCSNRTYVVTNMFVHHAIE